MLRKSQEWAGSDRMMYVVGATQGRAFEDIRRIVPDHFLLVPGVGAQGGSLEAPAPDETAFLFQENRLLEQFCAMDNLDVYPLPFLIKIDNKSRKYKIKKKLINLLTLYSNVV